MEVRKGYKQTEVGVIPEDWIVSYLGDQCNRITTGKLDANAMNSDGDYPFFTCAREVFRINRYAFDCQALLVSGNGANVGYIHYYRGRFNAYQRTYVLTDFRIDIQFARHFLERNLQERIRVEVNAGNTPYITMGTLTDMLLAFPPTPAEQEAIAEALSDADAWIESLEQLIAKKRQIKQGAMQELLTGKRRLPGFSGEWGVNLLRTSLRFQVGFPFSSAYFNDALIGVRLIRNRDLKHDDQVLHYAGDYDQAFLVNNGDVLIGMDGDFLPCLWKKGLALLNQRIGRIVPINGRLDSVFAYYYLIDPLKKIESATSSTTVKHLSHRDIELLRLPLPCFNEQVAIAEVLSDMDAEIESLETKLAKARQIKQGMMQELLTGRIRLV
jgi:type I restriction enzyme S subunit